MSSLGDGPDVSLLAFYDATPEARAATLERLRAAWEANTVLALGELVHVAALRADPTVASSWASGSLDEALEGLVERPYSVEPVVLRGTAEATIAELEARLKAAERERDEALQRLAEARAPVGDVDPEEVLRLDREGTPGPWIRYMRGTTKPGERSAWALADVDDEEEHRITAEGAPNDIALIATYRTAAPKLAREVIRLRELVLRLAGLPCP